MLHDVIVVGGGPAGMQAAIYAASEGLKVCVVSPELGGQIGQSPRVENFIGPAFNGRHFMDVASSRASEFGVKFISGDARQLTHRDDGRIVIAWSNFLADTGHREVEARAAILATGVQWKHLDIPGMREAISSGRAEYGPAGCTDPRLEDKDVLVIGAGNSAGQGICELATRCRRVDVVVRSTLGASQYLADRIKACSNVHLLHTELVSLSEAGDGRKTWVQLKGIPQARRYDRVVVCGGLAPRTDWLRGVVNLDDDGFIFASTNLMTSVPGVFAIGDARVGSVKRLAAAVGDGGTVVTSIWRYRKQQEQEATCSL